MKSKPLLATILAGLLSVPAANLMLDPRDTVFRPDVSTSPASDQRTLKMDRVLAADEPFDGLLLGSSRTGLMRADQVAGAIGGLWYNASWFSARPSEVAAFLREARGEGRLPHRVILGLDLYAFLDDGAPRGSGGARMEATGTDPVRRLGEAFDIDIRAIVEVVASRRHDPVRIRIDYRGDGSYTLPADEAERQADPEGFAAGWVPASPPAIRPLRLDEREVAALAAIRDLMRATGGDACFFWHPHRPERAAAFPPDDVTTLTRLVARSVAPIGEMTPQWAADPLHWYDLRHLTRERSADVLAWVTAECGEPLHASEGHSEDRLTAAHR